MRVMERAARKAGQRLRRDFGEIEHLQVSRKGPSDFVSKADRASERTLYDELLAARPDWGFELEEGGTIEGEEGKPRWVIDPLDGTSNFLHGIPHFAISIAVQEPRPGGQAWGELTQGLVYNPLTDESFWAEKGRGAWLNERRLRVSARRDLSEALIATGIPFKAHGDLARFDKILDVISPEVAGIRRFGSPAPAPPLGAGGGRCALSRGRGRSRHRSDPGRKRSAPQPAAQAGRRRARKLGKQALVRFGPIARGA